MLLGQRIRERRERLTLSQTELGRRIGKDGQYISKLERGILTNLTANTLEQLAEALVCSMDYLMNRTDDPRPKPPQRHTAVTVG
jgi:transcriptional regulator with XRE-family HTH domain